MPINVYFQTKYTTHATEAGPARGNFRPNFGPIKWAIGEQLKMYSACNDRFHNCIFKWCDVIFSQISSSVIGW